MSGPCSHRLAGGATDPRSRSSRTNPAHCASQTHPAGNTEQQREQLQLHGCFRWRRQEPAEDVRIGKARLQARLLRVWDNLASACVPQTTLPADKCVSRWKSWSIFGIEMKSLCKNSGRNMKLPTGRGTNGAHADAAHARTGSRTPTRTHTTETPRRR